MEEKRVLLWYWGRRGGGPRYTLELARALQRRPGLRLHLSLSKQSELFGDFAALGLPGLHVDTYRGLGSAATASLRLPVVRRAFSEYLKENRIDVVVCTMSHLWNVPVLVRNKAVEKFLLVLHDAIPHQGDDAVLRHWLLRQEIKKTDGVVTLTQHVRQLLAQVYSYPSDRSWVIPHGVFCYANAQSPRDYRRPLRLLFFGRVLPYKGLDLLLQAYRELKKQNPDAVQLSIVGPGDMGPYNAALADLPGISVDNRWIPEDEIGAIFERHDVVVAPYREASQSGVIATAYAAGLPVVATPIGGLIEQVRHGMTGLIAIEVSAAAIAHAIRALVEQPALYRECAHGALREARDVLAWPSIADRFVDVIQQVAAMPRRTSD